MGTWGIAIEMAKRNEQNLAHLGSKKDVYKKLVAYGSSSIKKVNNTKKQLQNYLQQFESEKGKKISD